MEPGLQAADPADEWLGHPVQDGAAADLLTVHPAGLHQSLCVGGQVADVCGEVLHILLHQVEPPLAGIGDLRGELFLGTGGPQRLLSDPLPGLGEPVGAVSLGHREEGDLQDLVVQDDLSQLEPALAEGALHRGLAAPSSCPSHQREDGQGRTAQGQAQPQCR